MGTHGPTVHVSLSSIGTLSGTRMVSQVELYEALPFPRQHDCMALVHYRAVAGTAHTDALQGLLV